MEGARAITVDPAVPLDEFIDEYGNARTRLVAEKGTTRLRWDAVVEDDGFPDEVDWFAKQHSIETLPHDVLPYLTPSRYCDSDLLGDEAWRLFGETAEGWARVQAICDHVHSRITFGYQYARPTRTAYEAWCERRGVCRDFAHVAITLCRAMNIPARYVSGYLGDIGVPPAGAGDFCAWFEVYLGGRWYTFDARYNLPRIGRVPMVRGHDAADVPMISSFGTINLSHFEVWCDEVSENFRLAAPKGERSNSPRLVHPPTLAPV